MAYFLVAFGHGSAWDASLPRRQQAGWDAHAAAMDALVAAGSILVGGPVGDDENDGDALMVVRAADAESTKAVFARDPWQGTILATPRVERWRLWLGNAPEN